jgi:hypothetical protein
MMPSWCRQVNWGNCRIPWVNCALLCVKDDWIDSSETNAIACQNYAVHSVFLSGMTSHSNIAQFNWGSIGGTAIRITYSLGNRNKQHCALICPTPLFYIMAPTCFGSSLSSSGSFLNPSELPEIRIEKVVVLPSWVHMHNRRNHNTPAHRPHKHTLYDVPPIRSVFRVTQTDPRSSLMMTDYCRNR